MEDTSLLGLLVTLANTKEKIRSAVQKRLDEFGYTKIRVGQVFDTICSYLIHLIPDFKKFCTDAASDGGLGYTELQYNYLSNILFDGIQYAELLMNTTLVNGVTDANKSIFYNNTNLQYLPTLDYSQITTAYTNPTGTITLTNPNTDVQYTLPKLVKGLFEDCFILSACADIELPEGCNDVMNFFRGCYNLDTINKVRHKSPLVRIDYAFARSNQSEVKLIWTPLKVNPFSIFFEEIEFSPGDELYDPTDPHKKWWDLSGVLSMNGFLQGCYSGYENENGVAYLGNIYAPDCLYADCLCTTPNNNYKAQYGIEFGDIYLPKCNAETVNSSAGFFYYYESGIPMKVKSITIDSNVTKTNNSYNTSKLDYLFTYIRFDRVLKINGLLFNLHSIPYFPINIEETGKFFKMYYEYLTSNPDKLLIIQQSNVTWNVRLNYRDFFGKEQWDVNHESLWNTSTVARHSSYDTYFPYIEWHIRVANIKITITGESLTKFRLKDNISTEYTYLENYQWLPVPNEYTPLV